MPFDFGDMMQQTAGGFVSGLAFGTGGNVMGSAYTNTGDYQGSQAASQTQDIPALRQAAADMQSGSADLFKTGVTVQDGVTGRPMLPAAGMADTQQGSNAAALDIPSAAAAGSEQRSNLASFGRAVRSGSALGENGKKAASVLYDGTSDPASYYFDFAREPSP